jgi:transposase
MAAVRVVIAADPTLECNYAVVLTIPGIGPVKAATMLAEVPNIAELTPMGRTAT